MGRPTRFAPLYVPGHRGKVCVPTLYAGQSVEAAAFESVFRDLPPLPQPRIVREGDLAGVGYARLALGRDLRLAAFFHQNLARIGQSRQSMIDTDPSTYHETVQ